MNNKEMIDKYSITKKTGVLILLQIVLMTGALIISLFGVFTSLDLVNDLNRLVVYGGQAMISMATIVFGVYYFNKKESKYFKSLVIGYALLEAIRVSLLQTGGIEGIYSFLAKFILVLLALDAALLSERYEKKEGLRLALAMVGLEILLYLIFIVGFPAVRTRLLYMSVPLVGILMAGSMCIFVTGRLEQISYSKNKIE
ncbi:MAG: hypothetical protein U0L72_03695 [Acutalibacteraceae bacterium]|nr:hypothetical protein [Acutalibacteraceae bacterium]